MANKKLPNTPALPTTNPNPISGEGSAGDWYPSEQPKPRPSNQTPNPNPDPDPYRQLSGIDAVTSMGENPLGFYNNPTYKWRFFVTHYDDLVNLGSSGTPGNYKTHFAQLESAGKLIVIAETGATGYSIDEIVIRSVPAERNTSTLGFHMEITEPLGTSMLEKMALAAVRLGIQNWQQTIYHLELTFVGYDPDTGRPVRLPTNNPIHKIWPVSILDINTNVSEAHTHYTIKLVPPAELGKAVDNRLKRPRSFPARTVGDVFRTLAEELEPKVSETTDFFILNHRYFFHFYGEPGDNIETWNITEPDKELVKPQQSKAWKTFQGVTKAQDGTTQVNFAEGASIFDIIDIVLACTVEGQKKLGILNSQLPNPAQKTQATNQNDGKANDPSLTDINKNNFQFAKVIPTVDFRQYDEFAGDFHKDFHFHIHLCDVSNVRLDPTQADHKAQPKEAERRFVEFGKRLNRRYDYLYTGLNNDILSLDLKMDNLYRSSLALMGGVYTNSLINDGYFLDQNKIKVRIGALYQRYQEIGTKIKKLDEQIAIDNEIKGKAFDLDNAALEKFEKLQAERRVYQNEQTTIVRRAQEIRAGRVSEGGTVDPYPFEDEAIRQKQEKERNVSESVREFNRRQSTRLSQFYTENKSVKYAENLKGDLQVAMDHFGNTNGSMAKIRFGEDDRSAEADFINSIETTYDRGRHLMGSVLNQIYSTNTGTDLLTIEMEIRGDPYWIGTDYYEFTDYQQKSINRGYRPKTSDTIPPKGEPHLVNGYPNFIEAQHMFLLTFNTPKERDEGGITRYEGPSAFESVYGVIRVESYFRQGLFTQRLFATRDPFMTSSFIERLKMKNGLAKGNFETVPRIAKDTSQTTVTGSNPVITRTSSITRSEDYATRRYNFVSEVEGNKLKSYRDTSGKRTVGVGFNMDAPGAESRFIEATGKDSQYFREVYNERANITQDESRKLFDVSIADAESVVDSRLGSADLSENQRISMVSMAYNSPSLLGPNLTAAANSGNDAAVRDEILYRSNGGNIKGIANRRYKEAALWSSGNGIPAHKTYMAKYGDSIST